MPEDIQEKSLNNESDRANAIISARQTLAHTFEGVRGTHPKCRIYSQKDISFEHKDILTVGEDVDFINPKEIYFIYMKFTADHKLYVRRYIFTSEDSDIFSTHVNGYGASPVEKTIRKIFRTVSIKNNPGSKIDDSDIFEVVNSEKSSSVTGKLTELSPADYPNFQNMIWSKKCFIAYAIDTPDWRFFPANEKKKSPIQIVVQDEEPNTRYSENDTFSNGKSLNTGYSNGDIYYFVNHHKKARTFPVNEGHENINKFKFDIFLMAKLFDRPVGGSNEKLIVIDPPGENDGPD